MIDLPFEDRTNVTEAPSRSVSPHVAVFSALSLLYFLPLWSISLGSYDKGGVLPIGLDAHLVMGKIFLVYLAGLVSFVAGSWATPRICWLLGARIEKSVPLAWIKTSPVDGISFTILALAFLASKILLIPAGVYASYAFDSGGMESSVWTASMFLSDALILASIIVLFSRRKKRILLFILVSALNGVNLLHGTRNFFVITLLTTAVYGFTRSKISLRRLAFYGLVTFSLAMLLGYAVFVLRSHVEGAGFALLDVLSPIIYESVFSQISLVSLLSHPILFDSNGGVLHLIQDVIFFVTPRALLPDKGSALWISQFGYLSPLGAFNGFASGLLYFGYLFPCFYFCVGMVAGLLHRWASNQYGAILYIYFTCDFLFRIVRDGYVIPIKILINTVQMVFLLVIARLAARTFADHVSFDEHAFSRVRPRRQSADNS